MKKVLCPGEALIDFVATEGLGDLEQSIEFVKKAGGAPANAAGAIAKFGVEAYFIGAVGNDPFGNFLKSTMNKHNINTKFMQFIDYAPTTLAFVSIDEHGERDFKFNRGADAKLEIRHIHGLEKFDCIHFASATAFLGEELEASYDLLLDYASANNKLITFDANYRDALFANNQETFIERSKDYISKSHIVKLSIEEAKLISGNSNIIEAGVQLQKLGNNYVLLTLGGEGTYIFHSLGYEHVPSTNLEMVDSTGAGDAFIGTVVALATKEDELNIDNMKSIVETANKVGALTTQNYGALESIPSLDDINYL